jgi:hypothetical protein
LVEDIRHLRGGIVAVGGTFLKNHRVDEWS